MMWLTLIVHNYSVIFECPKECEIRLNGHKTEKVNECKYLGLILGKHGK